MDENSKTKSLVGRLLIPSLTIACLSHGIVDLILQPLLPAVTETFIGDPKNVVNVAIARQLDTTAWVVAAVFALLLGVISVKYNHKKLLVLGILCIPIGALGCSLAPNFILMQIFYVIEGIGTAMIGVASNTLVGEILPLNKRPQATAWIMAGGISATVTGNFVIRLFFAPGSWQAFLLWFALPISVVSLIVAIFGIPSFTPNRLDTTGTGAYLNAFKKIFKNKSAAACLTGNMLRVAGGAWVPFYLTFLTQVKEWISIGDSALVLIGVSIINIFGGLIGGYLVNKIGRKRLPVFTLPIEGLSIAFLALAPDLVISLGILFFNSFIGFIGNPGLINLTFEQVPEFRGTVNSMVYSLSFFGFSIGVGIGGFALAIFGYTGMFFVYGLIILVAVTIIFFFAKDPCLSNLRESIKSVST